MGKQVWPLQKLRVDSLHELRSRFEKTLSSELADAFAKRLPAWLTNLAPQRFSLLPLQAFCAVREKGEIHAADERCVFRIPCKLDWKGI
jgi:hypothetical protein